MADKYQETMNPMLASVMQKYQAMANSTALNQTYKKTIGQFVNRLVSDNSEEKLSGPSAMRKAIRELTEQGISTIDHASGRTVRMDTMVRNSLMTEFTGIVQGVQRQLAEDIGADGVEISAHQHSAEDHEPIQGHTFANDEFEKLQNGDIAEDIEGEQFQTDRPIGMWNCRHMAFPVLIGISEPSFSPEELDAIKARNEEGIEFHGEHMTLYEAEQAQRKLETGMRRERENLNLLKEVRDTDPMLEHDYQKSKAQLAELRDEYKALGDVLAPKAIRMKMERSYVPRGSTGSKILKSPKSLVSKTIGMMPRNIQKGAELIRDDQVNNQEINNELDKLRKLGKETGIERLSVMNYDGTNFGSWKGTKDSVKLSQIVIKKLLSAPENSLIPLHNHPGSTSFSLADLDVMGSFNSIREMRVIGHNGTVYSMTVGNGQRILINELEIYEKSIYIKIRQNVGNSHMPGSIFFSNYFSERNRLFAEHFGWKYKEEKRNESK